MEKVGRRFEPEAVEHFGPEYALLASIAISAKRIADALERLDPERPLNAYGETIGECIQGQHERGLRGIPNP
jgi:hypothetical protein